MITNLDYKIIHEKAIYPKDVILIWVNYYIGLKEMVFTPMYCITDKYYLKTDSTVGVWRVKPKNK